MGLTLSQKIISAATNITRPEPGDILTADISVVMISEALGPVFLQHDFKALGDKFFDADRLI
jgi:homoaconitase/3-isopropylmalate dehydratase large subunit